MHRFSAGLVIVLFFLSAQAVNAQNYKQMVLGESTKASELSFPQIAAGPGVITPDSPLYFLDKAYQGFRLALASPEDKAKIRASIAGERLAELRLMMAKNDEKGINIALNEMTHEMDGAADDLVVASGRGNNVEDSAAEVNQKLKEQRFAIRSLIQQARGDLRLRLLAANESLKEAKVEVEGNLPEEHLLNEIEDDLTETVEEEADMATHSARRLEYAITQIDELASMAGQKEQIELEKIRKDEGKIDEALLKKQQQLKELKQRRLEEIKKKRMEAVREFREKAEEAKIELNEAKQEKILLELDDARTDASNLE